MSTCFVQRKPTRPANPARPEIKKNWARGAGDGFLANHRRQSPRSASWRNPDGRSRDIGAPPTVPSATPGHHRAPGTPGSLASLGVLECGLEVVCDVHPDFLFVWKHPALRPVTFPKRRSGGWNSMGMTASIRPARLGQEEVKGPDEVAPTNYRLVC